VKDVAKEYAVREKRHNDKLWIIFICKATDKSVGLYYKKEYIW